MNLYETDHGQGTGLALLPKLKYEHVHLSSFSKMRVDLAAQVSILQKLTSQMYCSPMNVLYIHGPVYCTIYVSRS